MNNIFQPVMNTTSSWSGLHSIHLSPLSTLPTHSTWQRNILTEPHTWTCQDPHQGLNFSNDFSLFFSFLHDLLGNTTIKLWYIFSSQWWKGKLCEVQIIQDFSLSKKKPIIINLLFFPYFIPWPLQPIPSDFSHWVWCYWLIMSRELETTKVSRAWTNTSTPAWDNDLARSQT